MYITYSSVKNESFFSSSRRSNPEWLFLNTKDQKYNFALKNEGCHILFYHFAIVVFYFGDTVHQCYHSWTRWVSPFSLFQGMRNTVGWKIIHSSTCFQCGGLWQAMNSEASWQCNAKSLETHSNWQITLQSVTSARKGLRFFQHLLLSCF